MKPIIKSSVYDSIRKTNPVTSVECDVCGEWLEITFDDYEAHFDCSGLIAKQLTEVKCDNCKKCVC